MDTQSDAEMDAWKARLKGTWESGDYGAFAAYAEPGALEFFDRLSIPPGVKMLDLGCGAGQITLPAARRGIDVTGLDLAVNLVEQANERARREGLRVRIEQGDAEDLPYADGEFDMVLSLLGAMFAPRPELAASEMARVCWSSGKIVMGNWTPCGFVGQMFKTIGKHMPPPGIAPSPLLWGDEGAVVQRLSGCVSDLRVTPYDYTLRYPFLPAEVVDFYIATYGPIVRAYSTLAADQQPELRNDLIQLWEANNRAAEGATAVRAEYVEVIATRC